MLEREESEKIKKSMVMLNVVWAAMLYCRPRIAELIECAEGLKSPKMTA